VCVVCVFVCFSLFTGNSRNEKVWLETVLAKKMELHRLVKHSHFLGGDHHSIRNTLTKCWENYDYRQVHIIHHTSYVIHHTSYIIHHTSHIIHHTSYITHHISHIIHHTSSCIHDNVFWSFYCSVQLCAWYYYVMWWTFFSHTYVYVCMPVPSYRYTSFMAIVFLIRGERYLYALNSFLMVLLKYLITNNYHFKMFQLTSTRPFL